MRMDMKDLSGTPELPNVVVRRILSQVREVPPARQALLRDLIEEVLSTYTKKIITQVKLGFRKTNKQMEYEVRRPITEDLPEFLWPDLFELTKTKPIPTYEVLFVRHSRIQNWHSNMFHAS